MLFESKYWWKEVGLILFLIFLVNVGTFYTVDLIIGFSLIFSGSYSEILSFDRTGYEDIYGALTIIFPIFVFLIVGLAHKIAIRKNKDNEYHLLQSKDWWKEFIIIIVIIFVAQIITEFILPVTYVTDQEIDFDYMNLRFAIVWVIGISITFLITWILHKRAIKKQKQVDSK
ncbi:MAG: hypothetical protein ACPKPY_03050 [Nitrososphaeraceae archaeon]